MPAAIHSPRRSLLLVSAGVMALAGLVAWLSSIGGPHGPGAGLNSVVYMLIVAGPPVAAYLLGSFGLGTLLGRWTRGSEHGAAIECCFGVALMLSASHALGVLGLLSGTVGWLAGTGVVLVGIVLLARRILGHIRRTGGFVGGTLPMGVFLALPAAAVLVTAACSPPGWLWESEHRGYDALSYHLQLPQEWIESGRIWPNDHNVYSYLPGYVESAFVHLGVLSGAPAEGRAGSRPLGLLAVEGHGVISCQLLHAGLAMLAAVMVGRMCAAWTGRREIGAVAGALFLSIPWVIVTGSLAYNEMGVAVLMAGAMIAAGDLGLRQRGVIAGALVGAACGCKPTALFMVAPVVGLLLLRSSSGRGSWWRVVAAAAGGGAVAIAPWIVRNWAASGNPVFPMAADLFGTGHWSADQILRYAAGHRFDGGLMARLALLFDAGTMNEPARGLLHPQWAILPAVAAAGWVVAVVRRRTRAMTLVLGAALAAQIVAWLLFTHLQSRFLLPVAVTGCGVVALGLAAVMPRRLDGDDTGAPDQSPRRGLVLGAGALICIGHAGFSIGIFSAQSRGMPNLPLLESPWFRTGELDRRVLAQQPERAAELAGVASPEVFVNVLAPPGTMVYLIGEARGLYYTCPILYNTTWDKWPLGEAMRRSPGNVAAWTRELWEAGVRLVLVNEMEIARLQASGWADPLVTPEAVAAWLKEEGRLVRSWPEIGVGLFELRPPGASR